MRCLRLGILVLILSLSSACNQQPPGEQDAADSGPDGAVGPDMGELTAALPPFKASKPIEPAPPASTGGSALLSEVRFLPDEGDSQFVELRADSAGSALAGFSLRNDAGDTYVLPASTPVVGSAQVLLVVFDGSASIDGRTIHADRSAFLNKDTGSVALLDAVGTQLDRVVWGLDAPGSVLTHHTGVPYHPHPGDTIGRLPQSTQLAPLGWTFYPAEQATPGAPNINKGVTVMHPLNGVVTGTGDLILSWFPVEEATHYTVQLADNEALSNPVIEQDVQVAQLPAALAEGTWYWRVQAIFADGSRADWSHTQQFTLDNSMDLGSATVQKAIRAGKLAALPFIPKVLLRNVPPISQHKDTNMLLLESDHQESGHAWDEAHVGLDINDKADNANCQLASTVMVNRAYGGHLSQDRLGFQLHHNDQLGPERDLNWDNGHNASETMPVALGVSSPEISFTTYAQAWADITKELDKGRPVHLGQDPSSPHATVVIGYHYDAKKDRHFFVILDPWNPGSAEAACALQRVALTPIIDYNLIGEAPVTAISDEPEISQDTDDDKINDFDEASRFLTDSQKKDTDDDCMDDKDEIRNSMFDPQHGYANYVNGISGDGKARGLDHLPPELTNDSDGGGLPDFVEDINHDGMIDSGVGETDPTNPGDDHRRITGTIDRVLNYVEDRSSDPYPPNYSYSAYANDTRWHADLNLETDGNGGLTGTVAVKWTSHGYFTWKNPPSCATPNYEYRSPDRSWTVNANGNFLCDNSSGMPSFGFVAAGTPDGKDIHNSTIYTTWSSDGNGNCVSSDLNIGSGYGDPWGSFFVGGITNGTRHDLRKDSPLGPRQTGESYEEIHLTIQK